MAEYIEREAVLKHKRKMSGADFGGEFWDEAVLCEDIRKIPTADVVEVVRCKDCKHRYIPEKCALWYGHYDGKDYYVERGDDFYCKYGERRCEDEHL